MYCIINKIRKSYLVMIVMYVYAICNFCIMFLCRSMCKMPKIIPSFVCRVTIVTIIIHTWILHHAYLVIIIKHTWLLSSRLLLSSIPGYYQHAYLVTTFLFIKLKREVTGTHHMKIDKVSFFVFALYLLINTTS